MKDKEIELRSPKVQNLIGKMPRKLVVFTVLIYVVVSALLLIVICLLDIDEAGIFIKRLWGK